MCGGSFLAWLIAALNKVTRLGLLSKLAERVTFVLIPPLLLIFLVLGTIFLGVATPTEGGAMGAVGALIMAWLRGRMSWSLLKQALAATTKLASFVMFILIGATVFSMVFQAADGTKWVEHLLADLPGNYLHWFAREGFPKGELGQLLALMHEVDQAGARRLLDPLRRP